MKEIKEEWLEAKGAFWDSRNAAGKVLGLPFMAAYAVFIALLVAVEKVIELTAKKP